MSWTPLGTGSTPADEEAAYRAMHLELLKQQEEAEKILLQKQKKKEQQLLQRQRRRKEQQAIRQEQLQQQQQTQQQQQRPRPGQKQTQGQAQNTANANANNVNIPTPVPPYQYQLPESIAAIAAAAAAAEADSAAAAPVKVKQKRKTKSEPRVKKGQGLPSAILPSEIPGASLVGSTESILRIRRESEPKASSDEDIDVDVDRKFSDTLVDRSATLLELSRFQCEYASDEDAIEADYYEPLARHAEFFTKEEVIRLYRSKLRHLRSMYMHQAEYLKLAYKEKRRLYIAAAEDLNTSNPNYTTDPRQLVTGAMAVKGHVKVNAAYIAQQKALLKKRKQLLAVQSCKGPSTRAAVRFRAKRIYNELIGKEKAEAERNVNVIDDKKINPGLGEEDEDTESLDEDADAGTDGGEDLFELFKEARQNHGVGSAAAVVGKALVEPPLPKCTWSSGRDGVKCSALALPCTKYCYAHILHDERQTLFKACGQPLGTKEERCQAPILDLMERLGCQTHRVPLIKEASEPMNKRKERLNLESTLPIADAETEIKILENVIADEIFDMSVFDEAMKYIEKKGLREPDSEDSDELEETDIPLPLGLVAAVLPPVAATTTEESVDVKMEVIDAPSEPMDTLA